MSPKNGSKTSHKKDITDKSRSKKPRVVKSSESFDQLIDNTYQVGKKLGSGSYGQVRLGTDTRTNQVVAIKMETVNCTDPQLKTEYEMYQLLQGKRGFPTVHYFGTYADHHVLVMEKMSITLEALFVECKRNFSMKSIVFLVLQLLKRFQTIHESRIVYRDVKPENFMLGHKTNTVYVIDFGLAKMYTTDPEGQQHIPFRQTNELIGTSRYMSINAHQFREQSRRDDLEALGYVFLYFLRGSQGLPWSGLKAKDFKEHNKMICAKKRDITDEELCAGYPEEFLKYFKYVRNLSFEQQPKYEQMRRMFKRLFHKSNYQDDGLYDWNIEE